jgi:type II secretory pathway component PulJ
MEMVVALAIFTILLLVVVSLENQMLRFDRSMRIRFMVHPEDMAVIARVRKDVLDAQGYPETAADYSQSPSTLILSVLNENNVLEQVVYDFSEEGMARRVGYLQNVKTTEWIARGVPKYRVSSFSMPNDEIAVRLRGLDQKGALLVDQILLPRRKN